MRSKKMVFREFVLESSEVVEKGKELELERNQELGLEQVPS